MLLSDFHNFFNFPFSGTPDLIRLKDTGPPLIVPVTSLGNTSKKINKSAQCGYISRNYYRMFHEIQEVWKFVSDKDKPYF